MKVTLESTTRIVEVNGITARVWEGQTESGIAVIAIIPRIAVRAGENVAQFEAELQECRPPQDADAFLPAFPTRMVL